MKLLLYCTKGKPYLLKNPNWVVIMGASKYIISKTNEYLKDITLNGKIVGECDYEVEETSVTYADYYHEELAYNTHTLTFDELLEKSCLNNQQLDNYLYGDNGYAIHIKNLHIFNNPKELSNYGIEKAPQNMMKVEPYGLAPFILISIRPEWLCKILNGEKTIEVRRKVLQVMKNEI